MTPERRARARGILASFPHTKTPYLIAGQEIEWLLDRADDAERLEADLVQLNSTNLATVKEAGHLSFTAWLTETKALRAEVERLRKHAVRMANHILGHTMDWSVGREAAKEVLGDS